MNNSRQPLSRQRTILGQGSFGCVVAPRIQCKSINKNPDFSKQTASKILIHGGVTDKNLEHFHEKFKYEIDIATKLTQIDRNNIYFLGGDNFCAFKRSEITNKSTKIDISNCAKKPKKKNKIINQNNFIFNIEMKVAYPFKPILEYLSLTDVIKMYAHLVTGIQLLASKTPYLFLDIKQQNLLIHTYRNQYFYPVFIDFSPTHVVSDRSGHNLYDYITKWNVIDYPLWPPEIKAGIILSILLKMIDKDDEFTYKQEIKQLFNSTFKAELKNDLTVDYTITLAKIADIVLDIEQEQFEYLPKTIKNKLTIYADQDTSRNNIVNALNEIILPELQHSQSKLSSVLREKIMLYELSQLFLDIVALSPNKSKKKFIDILIKNLKPDVYARLSCASTLKLIKVACGKLSQSTNITKYMLKLKPPVTLNVLEDSIKNKRDDSESSV